MKQMIKLSLMVVMLSSFVFYSTPTVNSINFQQFQSRIIQPANDTLFVVNFWATWCVPCVEEMPYFIQTTKTFSNQKVKIILVSLDFLKEHNKLVAFVKNRNIENEVYHLNAGNPDTWIDKIDSSWSGALPATVLYRFGKKVLFHEGELNQSQLDSIINKTIQ